MSSAHLVQVAVPLPVSGTYTYRVPEALAKEVMVGSRVLVPFGARTLSGVVTGRTHEAPPRVKAIRDVLDAVPMVSDELLRLTKWIAEYYCCGWGEAIRAALPPGIEVSSRLRADLVKNAPSEEADGPMFTLLQLLRVQPGTPLTTLEREGISRATVRLAERKGLVRVTAQVNRASVAEKLEWMVSRGDLGVPLPGRSQKQVRDYLDRVDGAVAFGDLKAETGASLDTVRRMAERGALTLEQRPARRDLTGRTDTGSTPLPDYHPHQQAAIDAISSTLERGVYASFLIHGVTGSGKTEVYLAALQRTLNAGRTGIVLVPEIALTPQTVRRFRGRFGDRVAVLHSRMSAGERFDTWHAIRRGDYSVVVGPRSAVLAPLENVGLIVVDEEHENSYKQFDPAPRYHARDVAVVRARYAEAVCVLGSATPSLESLHNAKSGKYSLLHMPDRVPTRHSVPAKLPDIRLVDMSNQPWEGRTRLALSPPLRLAIQKRLDHSEQIILLQNRRGYSPVLECDHCGWSPECPDCSVTMTLHKASRQIRCHYCGRAYGIPQGCPDCSEERFVPVGSGTQRVEEELAAAFPSARLLRMDLDTTGRKHAHRTILNRFGRGEADILLGTQMVAKGLDFERVTLVGVIDADSGLRFPDFRAEERTFQLLTQVAGRSGRADLHGEVLIQTRTPEHPVFRYVRRHDYDGFADATLPNRRPFSYPPFGRLVRIEFRADEEQVALRLAKRWAVLFPIDKLDAHIAGPAPAFINRVRKSWRFQVLIKASRDQAGGYLRRAIAATGAALEPLPRGARVIVDIDPVGLL